MTKANRGYEIYKRFYNEGGLQGINRKEVIASIVIELGVSQGGAAVYYNNAKNRFKTEVSNEVEQINNELVSAPTPTPTPELVADKYVVVMPDCVPHFLRKYP